MSEYKFKLNTGLVLHVKAANYNEAVNKAIKCLYKYEMII